MVPRKIGRRWAQIDHQIAIQQNHFCLGWNGIDLPLGFGAKRAQGGFGQADGPPKGFAMAKGMNKQGKNVKKPKKEVAKTAVVLTPSTKNTVVISGGKARD